MSDGGFIVAWVVVPTITFCIGLYLGWAGLLRVTRVSAFGRLHRVCRWLHRRAWVPYTAKDVLFRVGCWCFNKAANLPSHMVVMNHFHFGETWVNSKRQGGRHER